MSKKGQDTGKSASEKRQAEKKAAVLGTDKKSRMPLVAAILAFVVVVVVLSGVFFFKKSGESSSVVAASGTVSYPAGTFEDGKARHYQLKASDGKGINFFILKSSDGVIRAAFDACDVCWRAGLGYYQDGDVMVCRNCGQRFASVKVNEVRGGCNPAPLNRTMVGDQVVIKVKDILDGRQYFNLPKRS